MQNIILDFLKSSWTSIQNVGVMQLVRTLFMAVSMIPSDGNWPEDYGKTAIEQGKFCIIFEYLPCLLLKRHTFIIKRREKIDMK